MPVWWEKLRGSLSKGDQEMSFWEHLEELRRVLIRSIAVVLLGTLASYFFSERIVEEIVVSTVGEATFLKPMEAFHTRIKVAFLLGILVCLPIVLTFLWGFVVPGLLQKERRLVGPLVVWSSILFYAGVAFSYLVLTPTMLGLLVGFQSAHVKAQIAVGSLLDFIVTMAMACGLLFQLPLVVALLSMAGILTPSFLIRRWKHAIVGIFILTAAVTPGDGPSQIVLAAPVLVLYFASILVARGLWRGRKGRDEPGSKLAG